MPRIFIRFIVFGGYTRSTIHPHPKGCGLLYPLTPRDKPDGKTTQNNAMQAIILANPWIRIQKIF